MQQPNAVRLLRQLCGCDSARTTTSSKPMSSLCNSHVANVAAIATVQPWWQLWCVCRQLRERLAREREDAVETERLASQKRLSEAAERYEAGSQQVAPCVQQYHTTPMSAVALVASYVCPPWCKHIVHRQVCTPHALVPVAAWHVPSSSRSRACPRNVYARLFCLCTLNPQCLTASRSCTCM